MWSGRSPEIKSMSVYDLVREVESGRGGGRGGGRAFRVEAGADVEGEREGQGPVSHQCE